MRARVLQGVLLPRVPWAETEGSCAFLLPPTSLSEEPGDRGGPWGPDTARATHSRPGQGKGAQLNQTGEGASRRFSCKTWCLSLKQQMLIREEKDQVTREAPLQAQRSGELKRVCWLEEVRRVAL